MLHRTMDSRTIMAKRNSGSVRRRKASVQRKQWKAVVSAWQQGDLAWQAAWGPQPNDPACLCPQAVLAELGVSPKAAA